MAYLDGETSRLYLAHEDTPLLDLQSVEWSLSRPTRARGAGIGYPANTDLVSGIQAPGEFSMKITKKSLSENGQWFEKLLWGTGVVLRETVAVSVTTHTLDHLPVAVLEVRYNTSTTVVLREGRDFVVNYSTGVITFDAATDATETATVKYVTDDIITGPNMLENYCFEHEEVADLWAAVAAGDTAVRSTAQHYVGLASLLVTPNAQNGGAKYNKAMKCQAQQLHRLRFAIKGTNADTFKAQWTDAGGTSDMTKVAAGDGTLAGTAWEVWEYTFTPDDVDMVDVRIINTKNSNAFYLDHLQLGVDAPDRMFNDGGMRPFAFNIIQYDLDGRRLRKLGNCVVEDLGDAIGSIESDQEESISGKFLWLLGEES